MAEGGGPTRILSLLPAATETCFALGVGDRLVGVSHECDHPPAARALPRVSRPRIDPTLPSRDLDAAVKRVTRNGESLYDLDADAIARLRPDLVITQVQCEVCAVSPKDLHQALAACDPAPDVIELDSLSLEGVFQDMFRVAHAVGVVDAAKAELFRQWAILKQVRARVSSLPRRRVAVVDWIDPLMFAGNWIPDLVAAAGGEYGLVGPQQPSRWGTWEELRGYAPEAVVLAPCGRSLTETLAEWGSLIAEHGVQEMPAIASGRVFAADGHSFFNRPGPRLVYSAALLARAIHPEVPPLPSTLEASMARASA